MSELTRERIEELLEEAMTGKIEPHQMEQVAALRLALRALPPKVEWRKVVDESYTWVAEIEVATLKVIWTGAEYPWTVSVYNNRRSGTAPSLDLAKAAAEEALRGLWGAG